jgi:hypothetical protein
VRLATREAFSFVAGSCCKSSKSNSSGDSYMSTIPVVDRSAVILENDRSAVAPEKERSALTQDSDRCAVTLEVDRFAVTLEKDGRVVAVEKNRANLCSFTFADGRRCRTPRSSSHPHFCYFHARKEAQAKATEELGSDISYFFSGRYLTACDLSVALGHLFAAAAQGHVKPKTASTLAYLAQTLLQTIQVAQHEYISTYGTQSWRQAVHSSVKHNSDYKRPSPSEGPDQNPKLQAAIGSATNTSASSQ